MKKFIIVIFLSSCSWGEIRSQYELNKVISKVAIEKPSYMSNEINGQFWMWFFDEVEVQLSKQSKVNGFTFEPESRLFFDQKGNFLRGKNKSGEFFCEMKGTTNPKITFLYKNNCFVPNDSSWGMYKYSFFPKNLPVQLTNKDYIVKVGENYFCNGIIELISVNPVDLNGTRLAPGDVIVLKSNQIWKIKNKQVNPSLEKDICGVLRKVNYKLEY